MLHFPRFSAIALLALVWLTCCPPARPAPYDMVEHAVASAPGTGTITLGSAIPPYRSLSATSAVTGETIPYAIRDGLNWENGRGIVNFGTNITLTRGPLSSSIGGGAITATANAIVYVGALAEDMVTSVYPSSVLAPISAPPCAPATTTGTITLALGVSCANPVNPEGGSPTNWQFTLTGNGTLATTGPYKPGLVFGIQVTEGPSTAFTLATPTSGWFVQGLCTAVTVPAASCGGINGLPLSGVVNGKNIITCKIFDTTPTIWCGPVLAGLTAAAAPPASPSYVTGALGTSTGGGGATSSTVTVTASASQSLLCEVNWVSAGGATVTSFADGGGTNLTASDTANNGNNHAQLFYEINITGHSVSTLTVNYSATVTFGQARCDVISGATTIVSGGHALTAQSNIGSGTDAITTGPVTSAVNALVWGVGTSTTGAVTLAAGTGFILRGQDTSGANWNSTSETKISAGVTDSATFTNSSATGTNNFAGTLIVH